MSKEYKNIRVDAETYKYLEKYKLEGKLTSYTDVMKKLLGQEVEATAMKKLAKEDTVPKFVIEVLIIECLTTNLDYLKKRRSPIIEYVNTRLIELEWDNARPDYVLDLHWSSPFTTAIDNCLYRLQRNGFIEPVGIPKIKQYKISDKYNLLIKYAPDSTNVLIDRILPNVILETANPYSQRLTEEDLLLS
jgi:predicted CopG family antitoxin